VDQAVCSREQLGVLRVALNRRGKVGGRELLVYPGCLLAPEGTIEIIRDSHHDPVLIAPSAILNRGGCGSGVPLSDVPRSECRVLIYVRWVMRG